MLYHCYACKKNTEDLDTPPCGEENCKKYNPQKVTAVHWRRGNLLCCTGKPPKKGTTSIGSIMGVNCIRCRTKYIEEKRAAESSSPETS